MQHSDRIVLDPSVCAEQPVIRGTCVLVQLILGYLAHGESIETILREFPSICEEDVRAVMALAATSAKDELPALGPLQPTRVA
jgi:uncharacterized protein (DUF433 family)